VIRHALVRIAHADPDLLVLQLGTARGRHSLLRRRLHGRLLRRRLLYRVAGLLLSFIHLAGSQRDGAGGGEEDGNQCARRGPDHCAVSPSLESALSRQDVPPRSSLPVAKKLEL
jgi:hypothetical protein